MSCKKCLFGVVAAIGLALSPNLYAQSLKCGNDFTQLGETKGAIALKCGQPVSKDSFCKPADAGAVQNGGAGVVVNVQPCETVDEWTYSPGYGQFITTLRFESGVLKSVRYGDRVR